MIPRAVLVLAALVVGVLEHAANDHRGLSEHLFRVEKLALRDVACALCEMTARELTLIFAESGKDTAPVETLRWMGATAAGFFARSALLLHESANASFSITIKRKVAGFVVKADNALKLAVRGNLVRQSLREVFTCLSLALDHNKRWKGSKMEGFGSINGADVCMNDAAGARPTNRNAVDLRAWAVSPHNQKVLRLEVFTDHVGPNISMVIARLEKDHNMSRMKVHVFAGKGSA